MRCLNVPKKLMPDTSGTGPPKPTSVWYVDWSVAYDYRTDFAGHQSVPAEAAVNYLPGYGVMNAAIGLGKTASPWRARLWTHNMLGKTYRTRVKGDGLNSFIEMFGEPRSVGIDIEYRL